MKSSIYCLLLDKRKNNILTMTSCISCLFFGGGIDSDRVSRKKKNTGLFSFYTVRSFVAHILPLNFFKSILITILLIDECEL